MPAMAGQLMQHGLAIKTANGVRFLNGSLHQKTNVSGVHQPAKTNYYTTYTFTTHDGFCYHTVATCSGSRTWNYPNEPRSTWYKVGHDLAGAVAWEEETCVYNSTNGTDVCRLFDPPGKHKGKAAHGKVTAYSTVEHTTFRYTYTTFYETLTFYGPDYSLKSKTATSDSGQFNVTDKLDYVYYTTTSGKKHKRKKHTEQFNGTIHTNFALSFD